jgi:hypothetical protein
MVPFFFDSYGVNTFDDTVTTNADVNVTNSSGSLVYVTRYSLITEANTQIGLLTYVPDSFTPGFGNITVSTFYDKTFYDWDLYKYDSYVECGYDFSGDLLLKKTAPFAIVYCRSTEEGFTPAPDFDPINPSGLFLSAYWDFKDYPSSKQQVYKIKPTALVNEMDLSDNGQNKSVITTRLKIRGKGRSMRLRFDAEDGKNFVLLGYSVLTGTNARF